MYGWPGERRSRRVPISTITSRYITAMRRVLPHHRQLVRDEQHGHTELGSLVYRADQLMTCACIETSSAPTGSSSTRRLGPHRQRPGGIGPLPLPAAEARGRVEAVLGGRPTMPEHPSTLSARRCPYGAVACNRRASATMRANGHPR